MHEESSKIEVNKVLRNAYGDKRKECRRALDTHYLVVLYTVIALQTLSVYIFRLFLVLQKWLLHNKKVPVSNVNFFAVLPQSHVALQGALSPPRGWGGEWMPPLLAGSRAAALFAAAAVTNLLLPHSAEQLIGLWTWVAETTKPDAASCYLQVPQSAAAAWQQQVIGLLCWQYLSLNTGGAKETPPITPWLDSVSLRGTL